MSKRFAQLSQVGYTLLEQAIVFPAIIGVIVIATDLAHLARSYDALRQGVKTSLRCIYPASAACNQISTAVPDALYDVTRYDLVSTGYTNSENYSGTGFHINRPEYFVTNFQARVLESVHFPLWAHSAEQRHFPAEGDDAGYMRIARLPYITGSTPANATFRFYDQHGATLPPAPATVSTSPMNSHAQRWADQSSGTRSIGHINVTLPNPVPASAPCYQSTAFNTNGSHSPDYTQTCGTNIEPRVVLHIRGNSNGSDDLVEGIVRVTLEDPAGNITDLGGRHYTSTAGEGRDASLVPRGAPDNTFVETSYWGAYFTEFNTHTNVRMKYGQTYKLKFSIEHTGSTPGKVYYNPTSVRVFTNLFDQYDNGKVSCSNGILPHQEGDSSACVVHPARELSNVSITNWSTPTQIGNVQELGTHPTESIDIQAALTGLVTYPQDYFARTPVAQPTLGSSSCPPIGQGGNYGVPEPAVNGEIHNSIQAQTICPAPQGVNMANAHWTETLQDVPHNPSATWIRTDCSDQLNPQALIPALAPYLKLDQGEVHYQGPSEEKIYTGQGPEEIHHPQNVVQNNSLYNCSDYAGGFTVGAIHYNDQTQRNEPSSLFKGFHSPLGCTLEDSLLQEAVSLGLDSNSYFEVGAIETGASISMNSEPDSCTTHFYGSGEPSNPVYLGQFAQEALPADCSQTGYTCELQFAGFNGALPDNSGVEHNLEMAALEFGFPEVQVSNPKARWGCEGTDCVNIALNADSQTVTAAGTAQVGLLNIFGAPISIEMSYRESETLEANL